MKTQEIVKELQELKNEVKTIQVNYEKVSSQYIETMDLFEKAKIKYVDPDIRDSAEKQMMRVMKESKDIEKLFLDMEIFRRKRDMYAKKLDYLKEQIKILTSLLYLEKGE